MSKRVLATSKGPQNELKNKDSRPVLSSPPLRTLHTMKSSFLNFQSPKLASEINSSALMDESSAFIRRYFQPLREVKGPDTKVIFAQIEATRFASVKSESERNPAELLSKGVFSTLISLVSDKKITFSLRESVVYLPFMPKNCFRSKDLATKPFM